MQIRYRIKDSEEYVAKVLLGVNMAPLCHCETVVSFNLILLHCVQFETEEVQSFWRKLG